MARGHRFGRRHFMRTAGGLSAAWFLPRQVWSQESTIAGKEDLIVLSDRPVNAETPIGILDDEVTGNRHHFIRNNGIVPECATRGDLTGWTLTLEGEIDKPRRFSLPELQSSYPNVEAQLVLECGGNGRAGFRPPASGNQWKLGAVGCAMYRGVRLEDVLEDAGVKSSAVYVAYYGEDRHLSGDPGEPPISRGVPIAKAMDENTLLAWEMNGESLPTQHGFPLRLIAPGYPASVSGKWLTRLWVRDRVHDGPKMGGHSYRVPRYPVAPGTDVPEEDMEIIEAMPVKSIITRPESGIDHALASPLALRGHAWCGDGPVSAMHVSMDFGSTWTPAELTPPRNPFAWQHWNAVVRFPKKGHYEIWARATDHAGRSQPMVLPGWNPRGYLNNAMHRIAVRVA